MKTNILIVENNKAEAATLKEALEKLEYEVCAIASNLKAAINALNTHTTDLVLIDIFLGDKPDGLVLAQYIQENATLSKPFLFLTYSPSKKIFDQARVTRPKNYLIKPFNKLELQFAIELALEDIINKKHKLPKEKYPSLSYDHTFYIKKNGKLYKIKLDEIIYIKVEGRYCKLITAEDDFFIESSLKALSKNLPKDKFIRVHRNHIINISKIKTITTADNIVSLQSNIRVDISRRLKKNLIKYYQILQ